MDVAIVQVRDVGGGGCEPGGGTAVEVWAEADGVSIQGKPGVGGVKGPHASYPGGLGM